MKKNFKLAFAAAALLAAFGAAAQSVPSASTYYGENSGRISVQANTYAASSGNGGSLSHAETTASAYSNGFVAQTAGGIAMAGNVGGDVKAMAYNTNFGSGSGSANAGGWSDASFVANAALVQSTGFVVGSIAVDGGMGNAVRNGVDAHVNAGSAQDGFAQGTYAGTATLVGTVGQTGIAGGGSIAGTVVGTQTAEGSTTVGAVTFTGGTPANQTAAARAANTGVEVDVQGRFDDPAAR